MSEKILGAVKWLTSLSPQKRAVAYTALILISLSIIIYGLGRYIESSVDRDRKECVDNINRLISERDNLQIKLEACQDNHLRYVEKQIEKYESLSIKTENLKEKVNENN